MAAPGTPNVVADVNGPYDIFGSPESHASGGPTTPSDKGRISSKSTSPGCAGAFFSSASSGSSGASDDSIKKLLENYKIICEACERCSISFCQ